MRIKKLCLIITFDTTTAAMAMELQCQACGAPGRLIPVPASISAECGMCWKAPVEARSLLEELMVDRGVKPSAIYETL